MQNEMDDDEIEDSSPVNMEKLIDNEAESDDEIDLSGEEKRGDSNCPRSYTIR